MTTPTPKQMNEAQVAEYIKWLEKEIGDIESDSDEYEAGLLTAFEDARNKLLSLLSSSSTTGNLIDKDKVLEFLKGRKYKEANNDYTCGSEDMRLQVEDFISSLPLEQVEQGAAKPDVFNQLWAAESVMSWNHEYAENGIVNKKACIRIATEYARRTSTQIKQIE